jgi:hypothetical protein
MRHQLGFEDARLTTSGTDGGIDVASEGAAAQVKHYMQPVGAPEVQQLRGAAHGSENSLFYALSGYTPAAEEYANLAGVALFVYDVYGEVRAENGSARDLLESAPQRSARLEEVRRAEQQAEEESRASQELRLRRREEEWSHARTLLNEQVACGNVSEVEGIIQREMDALVDQVAALKNQSEAVLTAYEYHLWWIAKIEYFPGFPTEVPEIDDRLEKIGDEIREKIEHPPTTARDWYAVIDAWRKEVSIFSDSLTDVLNNLDDSDRAQHVKQLLETDRTRLL